VHPLDFFDEIVAHRETLLSCFEQAEPVAFHEPLWADTWSCEHYFRHLLAGMKWMVDAIPSVDPVDYHPLAVLARDRPRARVPYRHVQRTLERVTRQARAYLSRLTPDEWAAPARNAPGLTVEGCVVGLLEHEIEHHGMIRWILKRYTNWDDNEMYGAEVP
jgi:hypothetical protein